MIAYISDLPRILDWKEIDATLKLIHDCDSVAFWNTIFSKCGSTFSKLIYWMLEKFTMAYMDSSRQLDCAKELTKDSVAIIMTVNGYFTGSGFKILQYLKKSGCKVVLMTCNPELDIKIPIDHTTLLGQSKNRKTVNIAC